MNRRLFLRGAVVVVFLSLLLWPAPVFAQTARSAPWGFTAQGKAIVAVLPLVGVEEMAQRFHREVIIAVTALNKYDSLDVPLYVFTGAGLELPTDMPPSRDLVPTARYALSGGVYAGSRPGEYYLQLWLWDMAGSTMIYTDDLVYDDIDGAMESLPGLVEWLFSHIREVVVETPELPLPPHEWMYTFGVRAGLAPRWYVKPGERAPGAQSMALEGGLAGTVRLSSLLSLQLDLLFSQDDLVYRGLNRNNVYYSEKLSSAFLTIPLFLSLNFKGNRFRLSPMAGFYVALPLGESRYSDSFDATASYTHSGAFVGFSTGLEAAFSYGPGMIVAGLRYAGDFNSFVINFNNPKNTESDTSYRRDLFSFYVGYEFGFVDLNRESRSYRGR
jgi:hypothetical protein